VPSLFVIQGRNLGARYDLDAFDGPVSIGREAGNLVQLDDNEVSRRHAELRPADGAHVIVDLTSSNGTFVNGRRVERAALAPGDQVLVGRTVLSYARPPRAAQETVDIVEVRHDDDSRIVSTLGDDDRPDRGGRTDPDDRRLSRARSNLQVMYRTALAVSHTLDIDELLDRILQLVFEWVEADRGCVMLLDPAGNPASRPAETAGPASPPRCRSAARSSTTCWSDTKACSRATRRTTIDSPAATAWFGPVSARRSASRCGAATAPWE